MQDLNSFVENLKIRVNREEAMAALRDKYRDELVSLREEKLRLSKSIEMSRISIKHGNRYLTKKYSAAKQNVNVVINDIDGLIGNESGVKLVLDEGKLEITDKNGTPIEDVEGGGYLAGLATQLQLTTLLISDLEKIAILDEPISTMNKENSEKFCTMLADLGEKMQLFFVTQDPGYLEDMSARFIEFQKENGVSMVVKDKKGYSRSE